MNTVPSAATPSPNQTNLATFLDSLALDIVDEGDDNIHDFLDINDEWEDVDHFSEIVDEPEVFDNVVDIVDPFLDCVVDSDSESDAECSVDSEYERWAQHTDSVRDICDYDSDTGICEY